MSLIQYVVIDKYILGILHSTFIGHSKNMARFLIAFVALFAYANAFCFHAPGKVIDTKYYKEKAFLFWHKKLSSCAKEIKRPSQQFIYIQASNPLPKRNFSKPVPILLFIVLGIYNFGSRRNW